MYEYIFLKYDETRTVKFHTLESALTKAFYDIEDRNITDQYIKIDGEYYMGSDQIKEEYYESMQDEFEAVGDYQEV